MKQIIGGNDQLMAGNDFGGRGDIRAFFKNGTFVNFPGVNATLAIDYMNTMLLAKAVNNLWRRQKVFIMGGGNCNDNSGLGEGPANAKLCRDGKAWYLYFWKEKSGFTLRKTQWGWVDSPPGADELGKGEYAGISVEVRSPIPFLPFVPYPFHFLSLYFPSPPTLQYPQGGAPLRRLSSLGCHQFVPRRL
jgi:hypothetical protein